MKFQLSRCPGVVVLVDDDGNYLSTLGMLAPSEWGVELFTSPKRALQFVQNDEPAMDADLARLKAIARLQNGELPQAVAGRMLDYWRTTPDRFDRVSVVVSDYAMPAMMGLDLFRAIGRGGVSRILLTGFADETVAVRAFNERLIDHFVPKNSSGTLMDQISRTVRKYTFLAHPRRQSIFREALDDARFNLLQVDDLASGLRDMVNSLSWVEYVVLNQPFGVLGLSMSGKPGWIQLETSESLEVAAYIARDVGFKEEQVAAIRAGQELAAPELRLDAVRGVTAQARVLGAKQQLYAAVFDLGAPLTESSYAHWLEQRPERAIRD